MDFFFIFTILVLLIIVFYLLLQKNSKINNLKFQFQEQVSHINLEHLQQIQQLINDFEVEKERAKKIALNSSRNTIKGTLSEKFCPFQIDFPYSPADCTFLGKPLDFIVFHNIEKYRDNEDNIGIDDIEVIFLEIKTGKSPLTKVEKAIEHAVNHKRIRFETYRYNEAISSRIQQTSTLNVGSSPTNNLIFEQYEKKLKIIPLDFSQNDLTNRTESKNDIVLKNREKYARSFYKWSEEEIDLLIQKYDEGYSLTELSVLFQRSSTGLISRLEKLGVEVQVDE